jgi:hypothetical protein
MKFPKIIIRKQLVLFVLVCIQEENFENVPRGQRNLPNFDKGYPPVKSQVR